MTIESPQQKAASSRSIFNNPRKRAMTNDEFSEYAAMSKRLDLTGRSGNNERFHELDCVYWGMLKCLPTQLSIMVHDALEAYRVDLYSDATKCEMWSQWERFGTIIKYKD